MATSSTGRPELPLSGVRVIDLTTNVAGPFASLLLADFGADVWKVESPERGDDARRMAPIAGDGSAFFFAINRNKMSIALDLHRETDLAELKTLIGAGEIFVTNLRQATLTSKGLDAAYLQERFPHLIYADISGYGIDGPEASRPGYDSVLQSRSGLVSVNGAPGGPPSRVGVSILDMGAGLWLATGILAALRMRDQTGRGCRVSTSLLEAGASFMSYHLAAWQLTHEPPSPQGSEHPAFAPYGIFRTGDGQLSIGIGADHLFVRLAGALGAPQLLENPRYRTNALRVANRLALREDIEAILASGPAREWEQRLSSSDIPVSVVATVPELLDDIQLAANEMWLEVPVGSGASETLLRLPGLPLRFDRHRPPLRLPPPGIGEHTANILKAVRSARSGSERT